MTVGNYAPDGSQNVTIVSGSATISGEVTIDDTVPVEVQGTISTTPPTGASATEVQGTAAGNAAAVGNPVQAGGIYESTPSTYDNGDAVPLHLDTRGNLKVAIISNDSTGAVSVSAPSADAQAASTGMATRAQQLIFNGSTWDREKKATSVAKLTSSAATTNATVVKASAGEVYHINGFNAKATAVYLKLYNKATAPTVGTDVPVMTVYLAATSTYRVEIPRGLYFTTGIGYALTTGAADGDTGALGVADVIAQNIVYS